MINRGGTSVVGHQRRFDVGGMSAIAPIATKMLRRDERRKVPQAAVSRRSKRRAYSIISSASSRTDGGIASPIAFAVLALTTVWNLTGI